MRKNSHLLLSRFQQYSEQMDKLPLAATKCTWC